MNVNHQIKSSVVLVIDDDGHRLGILQTREGVKVAREKGLDLVEVSPQASPPVCKIMDYGRYKYQMKKKAHEAKKKQTVIKVKEVKLGISTDHHDLMFKAQHARRFLEEGNKVKVTLVFRGREIIHPEIGVAMMNRFMDEIGDLAQVEQPPVHEGRAMSVIVRPKRGAPAERPKQAADAGKKIPVKAAQGGEGLHAKVKVE